MGQIIKERTKWNLWKAAFKKYEVIMVCLSRSYHFKYFKGCLPQISQGPFLKFFRKWLTASFYFPWNSWKTLTISTKNSTFLNPCFEELQLAFVTIYVEKLECDAHQFWSLILSKYILDTNRLGNPIAVYNPKNPSDFKMIW